MTLLLDTSFVDVRGDALRWTLDPVERTPLAVHDVRLPAGVEVSLRVLGASHQVLVRRRDVSGATETVLCETVACDLVGARTMPAAWTARQGYSFTSRTEHLDPDTFATRVADLVSDLGERHDALVAHFPGRPDAVTALALDTERESLTWHTWHAYPQTGELVGTRTVFCPTDHRGITDA